MYRRWRRRKKPKPGIQPQNVMMIPPAESVEAVSVVTNSFDAEQGAAAGAAINVTLK